MPTRTRLAALISSLLLGTAPAAFALQDAAQAPAQPPAQATAATPKTLQTIYVTGSHIRAVDIETEHPLTVLTRAELLRTGLTDVADILQSQIVATGESLNRNVNNPPDGELLVDLRGLGANRTLVLVNGQRWVSNIAGAVDLTAIPLPLVERIEVLKDGASAIYGSDAIAGVINIITRQRFEGAEAGVYYGENQHGDGRRRNLDFTWGRSFGRWNLAAGAEYGKDDPIYARDRAISAVPVYGVPLSASGSSATPYGYYEPADYPYFPDGWVRVPGTSGASPDDFRPYDPARDANFNFATYNYLQTPQERRALFGHARFEASPTLAFSFDALFNQRRSAQQLAPPPITFSDYLFAGPQGFGVSEDNLYNPFGMAVDTVRLRMLGFGVRRFEQRVDTWRLHAGVDGSFTLAGRDLDWGVDFNYTRARQRESTAPYADNERLALAVGPSFLDASGTPRCGTPGGIIDGCVPLDVFGPPDAMTPAMLDYIRVSETNRKRDASADVLAHVTGPLAGLPAGDVRFAVGVEHRRESGSLQPDPLLVEGRENGNGRLSSEPTSGAYTVDEAYLEFDLPLVAGHAAARELGVTLATRYSHYSLFGSTTNSKLGLRWKPVDDLLVRASYGEGFRAPSIFEAFGARETFNAVGAFIDPCAAARGYVPNPATLANCQARGVPANVEQPWIATLTMGGNPDLQPETSRALTAGLVFSPQWLPEFSASADWYRIKVRNAMGFVDPQGLIESCYMDGNPGACTRVTRDASGQISNVLALQYNIPGGLEVDGWDVAVQWRHETRAGAFTLRWDNAYIDYWGEIGKPARWATLADGSYAEGNVVGTSNWKYGTVWRWRSVLSLAWQRNAWNASATLRHFSPITEDCTRILYYASLLDEPSLEGLCTDPGHTYEGFEDPRNRVASVTYLDLAAGWETPWKGRVSLGVRNALNRNPPVSRTAINSFFSEYDVPGRFWWAGYRQKF